MLNEDEVLKAFNNLNPQDIKQLHDINYRIQSNTIPWGKQDGGEVDENGVMQWPYMVRNQVVDDFVRFMYDKGLVIDFDWSRWKKGREWYKSTDENKYKNLDSLTILKLLTAVIRNDHFSEGAIVGAFEQGVFPRLIDVLIKQKSVQVS